MKMESKTEQAEEILKNIVKTIWGFDLDTETKITEIGISLTLKIEDPLKRKLLVGKQGKNISALRRLMRIWALRNKCNVFIEPLISIQNVPQTL